MIILSNIFENEAFLDYAISFFEKIAFWEVPGGFIVE